MIIHILVALILVDVLWIIIIMPYWNSKAGTKNAYWESLSGVHTLGLVLAFLELFLKLGLAVLVFLEYRREFSNDINDLFKISYTYPVQNQSISKNILF
jgi:hypothetical protein